MDIREYSESEIAEIIKEFKVFLKKLVLNASIDFKRKINSSERKEIVYSDLIDKKATFSLTDNDAFFSIVDEVDSENIENIILNPNIKNVINNLSKKEKEILYCMYKKLNNKEISLKLHLTEKTIRNKKTIIRNKIRSRMEEIRSENRDD